MPGLIPSHWTRNPLARISPTESVGRLKSLISNRDKMVAQRRKERRCELRRHHWSVRHDGDETNGVRGSECRVQEAIAPAQRYRSGHRAPGMLVPASSYGLQHRQRHESSTFLSPPAHSLLSIACHGLRQLRAQAQGDLPGPLKPSPYISSRRFGHAGSLRHVVPSGGRDYLCCPRDGSRCIPGTFDLPSQHLGTQYV